MQQCDSIKSEEVGKNASKGSNRHAKRRRGRRLSLYQQARRLVVMVLLQIHVITNQATLQYLLAGGKEINRVASLFEDVYEEVQIGTTRDSYPTQHSKQYSREHCNPLRLIAPKEG